MFEITGVQLLIVRDEKLFADSLAEFLVQHALEALRVEVLGGVFPEVQIVEALRELVFGQLVDVFLEREVDPVSVVDDLGIFLDGDDLVGRHPIAEVLFDLGMVEMKKVAGKVPDESVLFDGFAPAADFILALENEVIVRVDEIAEREAGDACADDEILGVHIRQVQTTGANCELTRGGYRNRRNRSTRWAVPAEQGTSVADGAGDGDQKLNWN